MPELPEVETTRCGILPHIKDQIIAKVVIRKSLRFPIPADMPIILQGKKITHVSRRAKYLLLTTTHGTIILHLGMSGHLRIFNNYLPPDKHDHVDILFRNNKTLRFTDPRRFGAFLWIKGDPHQHPLLRNLGVEPLTKSFSGKYLHSRAQDRKLAIKSFLMNQKIVVGIGNIYAAEALFAAGINPCTPAKLISLDRLTKLTKMIKQILQRAIKRGGTTLKDFSDSDGKPGYFSNQLKIYGRAGMPCVRCKTILQSMHIGQRNTVFCKKCQR